MTRAEHTAQLALVRAREGLESGTDRHGVYARRRPLPVIVPEVIVPGHRYVAPIVHENTRPL